MFVTNSKLKTVDLKIGDLAPSDWSLYSPNKDREYSFKDFIGTPTVFAFYPNNIGWVCTREVCEFRDQLEKFEKLGANVVCISPNTVKSHLKFAKAHNITNYPILRDKGGKVGELFGANGRLSSKLFINYGRTTFVIDREGKIILNHNTNWLEHKSHIEKSYQVLEKLNLIPQEQ